jgi:hypothetical protein
MNIWALEKDVSVKHLLLMLTGHFGEGGFEIVASADDDLRAVRLINPERPEIQLYVFTYGQATERYGVHIEYPDRQDVNYRDTVEIYEDLSFDDLVNIIMINLEVPQ